MLISAAPIGAMVLLGVVCLFSSFFTLNQIEKALPMLPVVFVGRDGDSARIMEYLDFDNASSDQIVHIVDPPDFGKTPWLQK